MAEKTEIYIIGFDETSPFISDVYCMKKIKNLSKLDIKLDAVFAKDFERFPATKKYCSNYKIEVIDLNPKENYFISFIQYSASNLDKKNLVTLISKDNASRLNWFFRQNKDFSPSII